MQCTPLRYKSTFAKRFHPTQVDFTKERGINLIYRKGKTPLVFFPSCGIAAIHPFVALPNDKVFRSQYESDQGFAFGNHELLKKLDQNF